MVLPSHHHRYQESRHVRSSINSLQFRTDFQGRAWLHQATEWLASGPGTVGATVPGEGGLRVITLRGGPPHHTPHSAIKLPDYWLLWLVMTTGEP